MDIALGSNHRGRCVRAALVALLLVFVPVPSGAQQGEPAMRATMAELFAHMRTLLELSADPREFARDSRTAEVLGALRESRDQAGMLAEHTAGTEIGPSFIASALDRYLGWAIRAYEWKRPQAARALLLEATDACVACHTRLPDTADPPTGRHFVAPGSLGRFAPLVQVKLAIATRQFDTARRSIDAIVTAEVLDPVAVRTALLYAMQIDLRVRFATERSRRLIARLRERSNLPSQLRANIELWEERLAGLSSALLARGGFDVARRLLVYGRPSEVEALAASGLINRWLARNQVEGEALAEAYYLLGIAEELAGSGAALPTAELYLESALISAPASPVARSAFERLVKRVSESYGGASLPEDVDQHLRRLGQRLSSRTE